MSDNEDDLLLLGGEGGGTNEEQTQQQPAADVSSNAGEDDNQNRKIKKDKKSKKDNKDKQKEKEKKKKDKPSQKSSGRRRQRDEKEDSDPSASESEDDDDDEDDGDVIDFANDEIVSSQGSDDDEESDDESERSSADEKGGKKTATKKKKRAKKGGAQFVADAASEGDDDDEFVDEEAEVEDEDTSYLDNYKRPTSRFEAALADENVDDAELARRLEARYAGQQQKQQQPQRGAVAGRTRQQQQLQLQRARGDEDVESGDGFVARHIEDDTAQFAAAFLPRPDDAKVYAVKVRGAFSKLLVTRLVNKCHAYLQGQNVSGIRQDLGILSVFSLPHVNEFIYVESHRQKFVETALAGLDGCFRFRITELSADAVMQLFTAPIVNQLGSVVRKGELIRVRNGPYKLDLGEVVDVMDDGKRVLLRLVPRLDFVNKEFIPAKGGAFGKKKTTKDLAADENANINTSTSTRPPQRLFAPALAIGVLSRGPHRYIWGPHEFDENGFHLKDFTLRQLFCGTARGLVPEPRAEELHFLFQHDATALSNHLMNSKPTDAPLQFSSNTRIVYFSERFRLGDPVRIVNGQLAGVTGRIEEMQPSEGRAVIRVNVGQQQQQQQEHYATVQGYGPQAPPTTTLTIDLNETCKLFSVGDQIAVERGPHQGDTGVVLTADGIHITYFSDAGKGHCTAEANDCSSTAQSFSRAKAVGAWKLFDIVVLVDDRTVGCIVSLGTQSAELLTQNNSTTRVPFSSIKHRIDGRGKKKPTDAFGNQIFANRETAVEVLNVPGAPMIFAGRVCAVKEVYEDVVFVRCNDVREHSGIGAVNCKVTRVLSGMKRQETMQQHLAAQLGEKRGGKAGEFLQLPSLAMSQQQQPQRPVGNSPVPNLYASLNPQGNNNKINRANIGDSMNYGVPSAAYTTAYGE